MMEKTATYCQSCGMPLENDEVRGREKDGSLSVDYCRYCYDNGAFLKEETMEEMIESCIPFELEARVFPDAETARKQMREYYPTFKRWKKA